MIQLFNINNNKTFSRSTKKENKLKSLSVFIIESEIIERFKHKGYQSFFNHNKYAYGFLF